MKRSLIYISAMALVIIACATGRKVEPDFPKEMLPHVRVEYAGRFEKGRVLYNLNCAKCHTTKKRGRELVPDFSPSQLSGYLLRVSNQQHERNMPDSLVSEEELGIIMTFLSYKKKNPQ